MRWAGVTESLGQPAAAGATLRDLMNSRVTATTPDTSVAEAATGMVQANVGSAVVMQGRFLVGILTERDVLRAAASAQDLSASLVLDWMTPNPESASPETPIEEAAQIMLLNGFRHLPIVDGREVCGVVSLRDLFAARIRRPLRT
jgi:CBS domain-containing protein